MSNKKQTPLQEAIQTIKERMPIKHRNVEYRETLCEAHQADIELLESMLLKEQQLLSDAFEAGMKHAELGSWTQIEENAPPLNKEEFINQYKFE